MSDATSTLAAHRRSTLRQLKVLVVLLVISNIALGAFGFYSLRVIDRKYSDLISQAIPTLNDMQTLTATSMETMRSVNPTLFGESAQSRSEMAERAHVALERDRALRNTILQRPWLANDAMERRDFEEAGDAFSDKAAALVPLLESGNNAEASRQREQIVRPVFNHYISATTKAADLLEAQSLRTSDTLRARTGSISNIMLGVAGWPVFILMALLLAVLVMILLIRVFLFKQESPV